MANCESHDINRISHKMRGSISPFGAKASGDLLFVLETMGKENLFEGIDFIYADAKKSIHGLIDELIFFIDNPESKVA